MYKMSYFNKCVIVNALKMNKLTLELMLSNNSKFSTMNDDLKFNIRNIENIINGLERAGQIISVDTNLESRYDEALKEIDDLKHKLELAELTNKILTKELLKKGE